MSFDFTAVKPYKAFVETDDFRDVSLKTCGEWTQNACCDFMEQYGKLLQGNWSSKLSRRFSGNCLDEAIFKQGLLGGADCFQALPSFEKHTIAPRDCPYPITRLLIQDCKLYEEVRIKTANGTLFIVQKNWIYANISKILPGKLPITGQLLKSFELFKEAHSEVRSTLEEFSRIARLAEKTLSTLLPAPLLRIITGYTGYPQKVEAPQLRSKL